jgi:hypothetical protein
MRVSAEIHTLLTGKGKVSPVVMEVLVTKTSLMLSLYCNQSRAMQSSERHAMVPLPSNRNDCRETTVPNKCLTRSAYFPTFEKSSSTAARGISESWFDALSAPGFECWHLMFGNPTCRELIASRPLNLPRFPFNSARRNDLQLSFILSREPNYALHGLLCIAVISNGNQ